MRRRLAVPIFKPSKDDSGDATSQEGCLMDKMMELSVPVKKREVVEEPPTPPSSIPPPTREEIVLESSESSQQLSEGSQDADEDSHGEWAYRMTMQEVKEVYKDHLKTVGIKIRETPTQYKVFHNHVCIAILPKQQHYTDIEELLEWISLQ